MRARRRRPSRARPPCWSIHKAILGSAPDVGGACDSGSVIVLAPMFWRYDRDVQNPAPSRPRTGLAGDGEVGKRETKLGKRHERPLFKTRRRRQDRFGGERVAPVAHVEISWAAPNTSLCPRAPALPLFREGRTEPPTMNSVDRTRAGLRSNPTKPATSLSRPRSNEWRSLVYCVVSRSRRSWPQIEDPRESRSCREQCSVRIGDRVCPTFAGWASLAKDRHRASSNGRLSKRLHVGNASA